MNFGIGNNDITKNYYNLDIPGKRQELYSEFYDLMAVMHTLLKNKYGEMDFPSLDSLDNLKNNEFDEDMYMTGLYEDLLVFKELFAYYFDSAEETQN